MSEKLYVVIAEHSPGNYGVVSDVVAESEQEAAEKFRYGPRHGWVYVVEKRLVSAWQFDGRMVPVDRGPDAGGES